MQEVLKLSCQRRHRSHRQLVGVGDSALQCDVAATTIYAPTSLLKAGLHSDRDAEETLKWEPAVAAVSSPHEHTLQGIRANVCKQQFAKQRSPGFKTRATGTGRARPRPGTAPHAPHPARSFAPAPLPLCISHTGV